MAQVSGADPLLEGDLQDAVIELAHVLGWMVAHFRPAKTDKGWRTPVAGDGKGFPDLVLVRRRCLIFAELKKNRGRLSPEQIVWKDALQEVATATSYVSLENARGRASIIPTSYAGEKPHAAVLMVV